MTTGDVVGPCQVLGDVDAKELKTTDSLLQSGAGHRGMFPPLLPENNSQLLCFADVEGEVAVLAPQCQFTYLLPMS